MTFIELILALIAADVASARILLGAEPELASGRLLEEHFNAELHHQLYSGDTALHLAAAARRADLVGELVAAGADVGAQNRRGATPLHYAADGLPETPGGQAETIAALLAAGAHPDAVDKGGVTPLHRAVRNRCADAVGALLEGGADASRPNGRGSSALDLAGWSTGRGGSGSTAAKAAQDEILRLLTF